MNKLIFRLICIILIITSVSCGSDNKNVPVYDSIETSESYDDENIVVPFKDEGGVKFVNVTVNGIGLQMIVDTGCSGALISVSEAQYLYNKGKLTDADILGTTSSMIADGSIVENMVVNLKEVIIDDKIICHNVTASVSNNVSAPLLLGNEVLNRVASVEIDNEKGVFIFKLK